MNLQNLIKDEALQQLLKERFATGEEFELISVKTGEKLTLEQLKLEVSFIS